MKSTRYAKIFLISLLLSGASNVSLAQEQENNRVLNEKKLLVLLPMNRVPTTFKNGQLLKQPINALTTSGWTYDEQNALCDQIDSNDPVALATLQEQVNQNHAWAQRVMAVYYLNSRSSLVSKDPQHAVQLLRQSAKQGDLSSQYILGWRRLFAIDFDSDYAEARYWLEKAASQGNSDAMALLGEMQRDSKGGERSFPQALATFRKAADDNNSYAYIDLAAAYANGEGVEVNLVEAYKWLLITAPRAGTGAFGAALKTYQETIISKLKPEQIDEASVQSKAWLERHPMRPISLPPKRFEPNFDPAKPCSKPSYPKESMERGEKGIVVVKARVGVSGNVIGIDLVKSSGFPLLDEATLQGISKCQFTPALRLGLPVEGTKEITLPW